MASSGVLRLVALVRTDASEELSASFIWVTRIGELGTTLALTSNRRTLRRNTKHSLVPGPPIFVTLMKEALRSSEISVLTRATRVTSQKTSFLIVGIVPPVSTRALESGGRLNLHPCHFTPEETTPSGDFIRGLVGHSGAEEDLFPLPRSIPRPSSAYWKFAERQLNSGANPTGSRNVPRRIALAVS
jgi:hypothetical protein